MERQDADTACLRFQASTPFDSKFILGKTLTRNQKSLRYIYLSIENLKSELNSNRGFYSSFNVIDKGQFEYIPKVRANSSVYYFNQENKTDGSLVVFPLKYARNKIFGTLGIDTLQERIKTNTFSDHELLFYQVFFFLINIKIEIGF